MILRKQLLLTLISATFMAIPLSAQATWYGENVEKGSDIMMMDVRWPWWPESTYYANWNFGTNPTGIGGYGGFTGGVETVGANHLPNFDPDVQAAFRPGSVWSFWGASKEGEPCRVVATSEYTYPRQYIGEGASGSLGGQVWPFIQQGRWYTMMMRVWEPAGIASPQYSYIGRWVKDVVGNKWHLYGIMRLPVPASSFTGNAGFLEDFGNGGRSVRSMHRRLGYHRKDGDWKKTDTVTYDVPAKKGELDTYWVVNTIQEGDHELLAMELSSNPALLPQKLKGSPLETGKTHSFTVRQPDQPTLDQPAVQSVKAVSNGTQVAVSWEILDSAAPQFSYRVEVFSNKGCKGEPILVREKRMPTVRRCLLNVKAATPTIRLTITDVFDQKTKPVILQALKASTPSKPTVRSVEPGLEYELLSQEAARKVNYFYPACAKADFSRNETHYWLSLDELKQGKLVQSGISRGFDMDLRGDRSNGYGFKFKGLLNAPSSGLYILYMQGADGYRIKIDGKDALVWDGPHGPSERTTFLNLGKGSHPISVEYFADQASPAFFKMEWEGPGFKRQEIPRSALVHAKQAAMPTATTQAEGFKNGIGTVTALINAQGHKIVKTQIFLGKMQIAESTGAKASYLGALLNGPNVLWARVVFDGNRTVDSDPMSFRVSGNPINGWGYAVAGEANAVRGVWQTAPDAFTFIGEGEYVISRKVRGDFTLTCRVDSFAGSKGEPVNELSWVGLSAREYGSKNNYEWGREFGIMQTGRAGLRTTPNHSDLGGGRINDYELPKNHPWLRVVRKGSMWTAWSSADGKQWTWSATHLIPARPDVDAGLVFRALPQDARAYFAASVSILSLVEGVASDVSLPVPATARTTAGDRITGVVMASSDPDVVVVRSTFRGLMRTTDGGKTWNSAVGNLPKSSLAVRSVAISPTDSKRMVAACGSGSDSKLYRTSDGGNSWSELDFLGDFDGSGPSALCGEVLAYDPLDPMTVWAGTETRGFWRSTNGGLNWKMVGAAGERVTAIAVNRWVRGNDGKALLHAVTCPDSFMPMLGRGAPLAVSPIDMAHDYVSRDGGTTLTRTCERSDLGYLNMAFDKGSPDEPPYATTHGILHVLNDGSRSYLFPVSKNLEVFRPITALGCAGIDDGRCGRALTSPLDPADPSRMSRSDFFAFDWFWQAIKGDKPKGGLISVCGEFKQGKLWWLIATDGLYKSEDGGATLKKVLDEKGEPVR